MTEQQIERFSEALERLSGDQDLLIAMAEIYVADAPEVLETLARQVEEEDTKVAATTAHKLKGMCSTFETGSPMTELEELVQSAKHGRTEAARATFKICRPQIESLLAEVTALTQS